MAVKEKIRVRLKSYDHQLVDAAAEKLLKQQKEQVQEYLVQSHSQLKKKLSQF